MHKKSRNKKDTCGDELQAFVRSLKSNESSNSLLSARRRAGLEAPCDGSLGILEEAEFSNRKYVHVGTGGISENVRNIPMDMICVSLLAKSLWHNIVLGID